MIEIQTCAGNTELNDLRKLFVEEKLKHLLKEFQFVMALKIWREHDLHCLQCSYTNDVINTLP